jgi:hypothetical protein
MSERYVVKLASGEWMRKDGTATGLLREAYKAPRAVAYRLAAQYERMGAVALRLKPSARAAELAKLRAEVEDLQKACSAHFDDAVSEARKLNERTAERDALAAKLAALPPDITDEDLAKALWKTSDALYAGHPLATAKEARRLLRGPAAYGRPVEELAKDLASTRGWSPELPFEHLAESTREEYRRIAKRARELGAR